MKKILGFIFLIALVLIPFKVNAESTLSWTTSKDSSGVTTVNLYMTVGSGSTYDTFDATLIGQHAIIQTVKGTDEFLIDETSSTIADGGSSARLITRYINGIYEGKDQKIQVAQFTYIKDSSYTGDEPCKISITPAGGTQVEITEKTEENSKTGSALPIVGITCGVLLIGVAYMVSRKSTKLYRM